MADHGWSVIQEFWDVMDEKRSQGLKDRTLARKERKSWKQNGAFENVGMAKKALAARKRGESLEGVFAEQKKEKKRAEKPKKSVVKDFQARDLSADVVKPGDDPKAILKLSSEEDLLKRRQAERQQTA